MPILASVYANLGSYRRARSWLPTLAVAIGLIAAPTSAEAATCVVDHSGTVPGSHPSIPAALSVCDGSAGLDHIQLYCDALADDCAFESFSLHQQEIELSVHPLSDRPLFAGPGGIVAIESTLKIIGDLKISMENSPAIEATDSSVQLTGGSDYLTVVSLNNAAVAIFGDSLAELERVQLRDSYFGLQAAPSGGLGPQIAIRESSFAYNATAGLIESVGAACGAAASPTRTEVSMLLGSGNQPNYVEGNANGFVLRDDAAMTAEHTIFLRNLGGGGGALIDAVDRSEFNGLNLLAYDNDHQPNPGQDLPNWNNIVTGSLLRIQDCATMEVNASTLAHNQIENALSASSTEPMYVYSSVLYQAGRKGLDGSTGTFFSDGTTTIYGSFSDWDGCEVNYYGPPVASCPAMQGTVSDDPQLDASTALGYSPYPTVMETLYLVGAPAPVGPDMADDLFDPSTAWSVDGIDRDIDLVDWGYHNVCSGCP